MNAGEVVDDRFEIERRVASGGMGHIYRARDLLTGNRVAVKLLHGHASERPVRFQREVDALLTLHHPGIVRYVANGQTAQGVPWMAMEWLEGVTLGERLTRGPLTIEESIELGAGLAASLAAVHSAGLIHRDLKPSNIFLVDGAAAKVKLIDFGLARPEKKRTDLTAPGMVLGTIGYLAPEQARGEPTVDARADVFALGCVLFRCVTGKRPFVGDDDLSVLLKIIVEEPPRLCDLRVGVPRALDALVARMLSKSPAARPADGAAVGAAIAALSTGGPTTVRSSRIKPEIGPSERRVMGLVLTRELVDTGNGEGAARPPASTSVLNRMHGTVERHRGQLEVLADGSSVVVFTSDGEATDLAARAARCGLSLGTLFPQAPVAVVAGRADPTGQAAGHSHVTGRHMVGELIDRAVALLPGARTAGKSLPPPGPGPKVRVDDVTARLLGPGFAVDDHGWVSGEREAIDAPRTFLGRATECVGRDRELGMLEDAYARAVEEPGAGAVLVSAPAGMGKSRLASELVRRLRRRDPAPEIWIGRGDPMSAGSAFGLIAQALRRGIGLPASAPLEVRRDVIRERVARRESRPDEAARVAAFLGELLGTPFPGDVQLRAARRDPVILGDQIRRAFEDFLRAECAAGPLVLVLEDLHWGDLPTIQLVDAALRHLDTRPFFVLALGRPEVRDAFPDLWSGRAVEEVQLGRLPRRAGETLARQMLGEGASPETVAELVERADGNALFLEELIRAVAEGKGAALPETVLAIVQARLEALHGEERRVLRAAGVFGQTFREEGVTALLGGLKAHGWLRNLVDQELIAPARDGYRFRHALVREAAYGMLTDADRVLGHRLAGEWLEASGERDSMVLAEHFERGLEYPRAAGWYQRAAEHAFEGNDLKAALARSSRGLVCVEDPESPLAAELLLVRAKASRWIGKLQDAEEGALWAMRLFPRGGTRWCEAVAEAVHVSGKLGHTDELLACTQALLSLELADLKVTPSPRAVTDPRTPTTEKVASNAPTPAQREVAASYAIALARAATNLQLSGRQALVEMLLERADEAAERAQGDPEVVGQVQWARSLRVLAAGDVGGFLGLAQSSLASLERAGDLRSACVQALNVGHGLLELGMHEEAARVFRDNEGRAERLGLGNARSYAKLNLGQALAALGRLDEARAVITEALDLFRSQSDKNLEAIARTYLARTLCLAGEHAFAATEALAVAEDRATTPAFRALSNGVLAAARLAQGRPAEAPAAAESAMSTLTALDGIEEGEAFIRLVHAEALQATGDAAAARDAVRDAQGRLLARAEKVVDPAFRRSFLENVPENARTLALAAAW